MQLYIYIYSLVPPPPVPVVALLVKKDASRHPIHRWPLAHGLRFKQRWCIQGTENAQADSNMGVLATALQRRYHLSPTAPGLLTSSDTNGATLCNSFHYTVSFCFCEADMNNPPRLRREA